MHLLTYKSYLLVPHTQFVHSVGHRVRVGQQLGALGHLRMLHEELSYLLRSCGLTRRLDEKLRIQPIPLKEQVGMLRIKKYYSYLYRNSLYL